VHLDLSEDSGVHSAYIYAAPELGIKAVEADSLEDFMNTSGDAYAFEVPLEKEANVHSYAPKFQGSTKTKEVPEARDPSK